MSLLLLLLVLLLLVVPGTLTLQQAWGLQLQRQQWAAAKVQQVRLHDCHLVCLTAPHIIIQR
jgi:hypothetical protein